MVILAGCLKRMAGFRGKSGTLSTPSNPKSPKDPPSEGLRRLYGRRQAFRLRDRQDRLVKELLPKLEIKMPEEGPLDPHTLFPEKGEIWLEIGFGGGEHLVWQAEHNPGVGHIGCEPFVNGVAKLLSKIDDQALMNIRIFPGDARPLLERLPEASIARAFLLFPDPWPKSRHHKRRFVQTWVLDELARVLKDGAEFRVASDIPGYVAWTLERMMPHPGFEWTAERPGDWRNRPADWPQTRYEAKAVKAGRRPAYLKFRRILRETVGSAVK
jgi:tRNA (guanine-N7-)-methyltransferase